MSGQADHAPWRVALVLDGDRPVDGWSHLLADDAIVVAADGGARHAGQAGVHVDHLVGDLDSLSDADVAAVEAAGAVVHRYPVDKDETDFELAAELAVGLASVGGDAGVLVVGGSGGRHDHQIGNVLVLAGPRFATTDVTALMGRGVLQVARPDRPVELYGEVGALVSLYPVGVAASGVTTDGLRYALRDDTLAPGSARGTSNVVKRASASVRLVAGVLLVVEPDAVTTLIPRSQESP